MRAGPLIPMLFAENVTKTFGAVDVLSGLTFIVGDGEHVGIVGPNGGGKSTILRLLAGDHKPDEGAAGFRNGALGLGTSFVGTGAGPSFAADK